NGSGKSNILDSICFVLGITNMSTVRASNLLDLIYKRGQAGVTRASVTIVFDNSDVSKAPVGYEAMPEVSVTRQIALNGTSKYLICGHRSTQDNVQRLFQSVGLNINNPNFLIMQGKITKVLNMRPQEILSMIEEAAGTSMFEEKKGKAVKTMAKKEKRLEEIQSLLKEEIVPKLDKLRDERRVFLEFQKKASELERILKLIVAYDWTKAEASKEKGLAVVEEKVRELKNAVDARGRMEGEVKRMENDAKEIEKRREKELAKGGKRQALIDQQNELAREHSKVIAQVDISNGNVKEEESKIKELEASAKELTAQRQSKLDSSTKSSEAYEALKATYDVSVSSLEASENLLQTLVTGISSSSEDASAGFMGQLAATKATASNAKTEAEKAKTRIKSLEKELSVKEPKAKKASSEGTGLVGELEDAKKEVTVLEGKLGKLGWNEEVGEALRTRKEEVEKVVRKLLEDRDVIKSGLAALEFEYTKPYPQFDDTKVKGLIANLITLDAASLPAATALEVCAGGRLWNVVVEDENVGSDLLKKGNLRKRVTIIPLNKITPQLADKNRMAAVKKLSKETELALSLVGSDAEVSKAMEYVFGNTLICPDAKTANLVTFNQQVKMRSVTLDGDVYDPSGTLSGGSKSSGGGVLIKVQKLKKVEAELREKKEELRKVEKEWDDARGKMNAWNQAKKAVDLKKHEVTLLEERVKESNATRIIAEVDALKTTIAELQQTEKDAKAKEKAAHEECKRIEKEMDEFKNNRGSKLDEIKAKIKSQKAEVAKHTSGVKTLQREVQTAKLELDQLDADIASGGVELAEARTHLAKTKESLAKLNGEVTTMGKELKSIEAKIAEETKMLTSFTTELNELDAAIKRKQQELADGEIQVDKLEAEIDRLKKESKGAAEFVSKLEAKHTWIQDEKLTFGKENSPYNFNGFNMKDVKEKCAVLEEEQNGMRKKVNPKVLSMIDSVEKKEKELMGMYRQVLKDKTKIEETVAKLDSYKKDALEACWKKVDVEFGNIFAELLPGNFCKLQPPEGWEITQGLEVKVRLGQVWKASLTELSGGQRSLIALSLILSLLHIKPAPMYILDEVDAALDLSHTENIGRLFKNRFGGSQFIVVSLKDGLFSNANVLFRTKFRDGTSLVERTTQRSNSALYNKENEGAGGRNRGKGRVSRPNPNASLLSNTTANSTMANITIESQ
ncbi:nuclear condensin complex protein, partial [Pseudohyphozyma bogoriensis]